MQFTTPRGHNISVLTIEQLTFEIDDKNQRGYHMRIAESFVCSPKIKSAIDSLMTIIEQKWRLSKLVILGSKANSDWSTVKADFENEVSKLTYAFDVKYHLHGTLVEDKDLRTQDFPFSLTISYQLGPAPYYDITRVNSNDDSTFSLVFDLSSSIGEQMIRAQVILRAVKELHFKRITKNTYRIASNRRRTHLNNTAEWMDLYREKHEYNLTYEKLAKNHSANVNTIKTKVLKAKRIIDSNDILRFLNPFPPVFGNQKFTLHL